MHHKFESFLNANAPVKQAKLLLAISGGVDSMVLWKLVEEAGLKVELAHVNYQLRDDASEKDQAFLEKEAQKQQTKLHLLKLDAKKYAIENKQSTQIAAREIRYEWFEELMHKNNLDYLLTAHHLDDSIETFFINLDRGTGLKGLTGIHSKGKLIRPLLDFSKEELIAYAKENEVPYREDATNADSIYLRNWFRNELLPLWKDKNPSFKRTMQSNMQRLSETQAIIDELVESDLINVSKEVEFISFKQIEQMKLPKQALFQILEPKGFNYTQVEQLLDAIAEGYSGKQFFSQQHQLTVDREGVFLNEQQQAQGELEEVSISIDTKQLENPFKMRFSLENAGSIDWGKKQGESFDLKKLSFPLKLRKWKQGDRIKPLGMRGKKLVSDILIDDKIPLHQKADTYVLLSAEQVVAVLGLRISDDFKVTNQTAEVWQMQWEK